MVIDELFSQVTKGNLTSITFPASWGQGRTAFGGLSAALLYCAIRQQVADNRVLRSLNTTFIGPLESDTPFEISVDVLRKGKSASIVQATAFQHGKNCISLIANFGEARESSVSLLANDTHNLQPPQSGVAFPYIENVTPAFCQHIDVDLQLGEMPFTGSQLSSTGGWMRFKVAPDCITDAHIITLIDAWPPTCLQMVKGFAPASTLSWNLEFIHPHSEIKPDDWLAYEANTRQAADGYAHTEANIWDAKGGLIAVSRQCVTIFA